MIRIRSSLILFLFFFTGCTVLHTPQGVSLVEQPEKEWLEVLQRFVDKEGRVDFKKLSKEKEALEKYVYFISQSSPENTPEKFPDRDSKLAYYINSYNALAMYGIIKNNIPENLNDYSDRFDFFYLNTFIIGQKKYSLYDYENKVIRTLGEERVHFALNCMSVGCPRLPQEPFVASRIDNQLEEVTFEFFNKQRNLEVVPLEKKVLVSEILSFYKEDFIDESTATLIEYINRYRTVKIPEGYTIEFIPYDWTVNASS